MIFHSSAKILHLFTYCCSLFPQVFNISITIFFFFNSLPDSSNTFDSSSIDCFFSWESVSFFLFGFFISQFFGWNVDMLCKTTETDITSTCLQRTHLFYPKSLVWSLGINLQSAEELGSGSAVAVTVFSQRTKTQTCLKLLCIYSHGWTASQHLLCPQLKFLLQARSRAGADSLPLAAASPPSAPGYTHSSMVAWAGGGVEGMALLFWLSLRHQKCPWASGMGHLGNPTLTLGTGAL